MRSANKTLEMIALFATAIEDTDARHHGHVIDPRVVAGIVRALGREERYPVLSTDSVVLWALEHLDEEFVASAFKIVTATDGDGNGSSP